MIDDWPGRWPYRLFIILTALLLFSLSAVIAQADEIGPLSASHPSETPTWSSPLLFFQRVISRADGDRCPMYPSCSHYAATVFKRFNPVTAWILTCDRLLRCGHDAGQCQSRAGGRRHPCLYLGGPPAAGRP